MSSEGLQLATKSSEFADASFAKPSRSLRVLLIQPPTENCVVSLLPQVESDGSGIGFKPPLGILYVASLLKAASPHEVRVIDAQAERLSIEEVARAAKEFGPDLIGISAWTDWWYPSFSVGQRIRHILPNVHICYGGPHVSIYAETTLRLPHVDSVIVGDGEMPFLFLANMLANGKLEQGVPGLHFSETGVQSGSSMYFIQGDLDELPHPDRTLLPITNYSSVLAKGRYVTTMVTSRGCPHKCTFCKLNFQKTLCRSAENVAEEFRSINELGIGEVELYDDTFTWAPQRVLDICDSIVRDGLNVEWAIRDRVSNARADLMEAMYAAGCRRIHYGIESGSDTILDLMKKRITTAQARRAVALAKDHGMTVLTYFMFGNPGETVDDIRRTIDFAMELDADFAEFSITIPYAGTEMYDQAIRENMIESDYWQDYAALPVPDFMPPKIIEEAASLEQLIDFRDEAIRRFYFRPRYLAKQAMSVNNPIEFLRKASMGRRLFSSVYSR